MFELQGSQPQQWIYPTQGPPFEMQARSLCFHFSHYLGNKICMFNLSNMYHPIQTVTAASLVGVPWSTDDDVSWAAADVLPR